MRPSCKGPGAVVCRLARRHAGQLLVNTPCYARARGVLRRARIIAGFATARNALICSVPNLQAGGHRFDPGTLHRPRLAKRWLLLAALIRWLRPTPSQRENDRLSHRGGPESMPPHRARGARTCGRSSRRRVPMPTFYLCWYVPDRAARWFHGRNLSGTRPTQERTSRDADGRLRRLRERGEVVRSHRRGYRLI
jgi:hypothetical protein